MRDDIVLVLDAMGVIYAAADDVVELLVPFVKESGGIPDEEVISRDYMQASLGAIDADQFWQNVGLSPDVEDRYLSRHSLTSGLTRFLKDLPAPVSEVWCLSNDVARWSQKLREMHDLESRFAGFVISGDVNARKPDEAIYSHLLSVQDRSPQDLVFVDDRVKNLDAAHALGMQTVWFGPGVEQGSGGVHVAVRNFTELRQHFADTGRATARCQFGDVCARQHAVSNGLRASRGSPRAT